jgi:hypothetical protein
MSTDNKEKTAVNADVDAGTIDEIDEIMNEIEKLQKGMESAAEAKPAEAPKLRAVPNPPVEDVPAEPTEPTEDDMKDFRGGADDASMEETLSGMKEEPKESSILDAAIDEVVAECEEKSDVEQQIEAVVEDEQTYEQTEESYSEPQTMQEDEIVESEVTEETNYGTTQEGCLTMSLQGNMTLKLKYEYEGQDVTIGFSDNTLKVQLSDGTEFKIPIARAPGKLRAVA